MCELESLVGACLSFHLRLLDKNEIYEWIGINMPITVYYNYEQEVLLRVLRHLPEEQLTPDASRALRRQEAQAADDRTLPTD